MATPSDLRSSRKDIKLDNVLAEGELTEDKKTINMLLIGKITLV